MYSNDTKGSRSLFSDEAELEVCDSILILSRVSFKTVCNTVISVVPSPDKSGKPLSVVVVLVERVSLVELVSLTTPTGIKRGARLCEACRNTLLSYVL